MKKTLIKISLAALALAPIAASAQALSAITNVNQVVSRFTSLINTFTVVLIAIAVAWIIFNVVKYFVVKGADARKEGGLAILYGIIGLFVIVSIWGLVSVLQNSFYTNGTAQSSINNVEIQTVPAVQ